MGAPSVCQGPSAEEALHGFNPLRDRPSLRFTFVFPEEHFLNVGLDGCVFESSGALALAGQRLDLFQGIEPDRALSFGFGFLSFGHGYYSCLRSSLARER